MNTPFPKRTYRSLGQVWADVKYVMQRRALIRSTMRGGLSPQFRERLMLAVTPAPDDAQPAPDMRDRLIETYGPAQADRMELVLRLIRMGNLSGNSVDAVLYRLSFGRIGHQPQKGLTS